MQFQIEHDGQPFRFTTYSAGDAIARRMRKYRTFYERDLLDYSRALLAELPLGGLIIDIGANFGNHSVYWAAFSDRHVVAIEANPALTPLLTANLHTNSAAGEYTVVSGGAGDHSTMGRMRPSARAPDQFGLAGVESRPDLRAGEEGVFEVHALSEWMHRIGRSGEPVRLLKIDVEGAEIPVISGAIPILERDRPEIFAEAATPEERTALDVALAPWGYRRIKRFCSTPTWHYSTERSSLTRWRWRRLGDAARLQWRYAKLKHSIVSRIRPAA